MKKNLLMIIWGKKVLSKLKMNEMIINRACNLHQACISFGGMKMNTYLYLSMTSFVSFIILYDIRTHTRCWHCLSVCPVIEHDIQDDIFCTNCTCRG